MQSIKFSLLLSNILVEHKVVIRCNVWYWEFVRFRSSGIQVKFGYKLTVVTHSSVRR